MLARPAPAARASSIPATAPADRRSSSFLGLVQARADRRSSPTRSAATQASDPRTRLHYLRTTNPLNLENLAAYPKRLGTNRPNPYQLPGGFDRLAKGLPVYENRHCGNGVPTIVDDPARA